MPKAKKPPPRKKPARKSAGKKPTSAPVLVNTARGQKHRDEEAARNRQYRADTRDIMNRDDRFPLGYGELEIEDIARRERCRNSLRLFCETYNPEAFSLGWSEDHLAAIARIEEAVTLGAKYAFAMARGSGKTSICRHAALWALAYAKCRYVFVIGATDSKAADTLDAIRMFIRFMPTFAADFPDISYPIQRLEGIANRSHGQTCGGRPTMIEWTADMIVLPTVPPPSNWPKRWDLRGDGMAPTSGNVVSTSGLTGEGIRGSLKALTTGEQVRPDFVLLDDPQTAESSGSRTQNAKREQLISADVLGMAGPGKTISAIMPCTVIQPGDCIDRLTDRTKHPLWRGERSGILRALPTDMTAWDAYFDVYRRCALKEPPDFTEANNYYIAHRDKLDAGAVASWEARKLDSEVSAVQHAMNLYARDRRAFMAEYMNQPEPIDLGERIDKLDAAKIIKRLNRVDRGVVPAECSRLTAFVDCGGLILHYVICAWADQFHGAVIDYGTFPRQNRAYYAAADARPSLVDEFPTLNEETRVYAGLRALIPQILGRRYEGQDGGEFAVERCLIDAAKWTKTVTQFVRQNPLSAILRSSRGWGITPGRLPMANWPVKPGEIASHPHWRVRANTEGGYGQLVLYDTNYWKSFVAAALQSEEVGPCSLQLFGKDSDVHRLFADHMTAEYAVRVRPETGDRRPVDVWSQRPDKPDNHWWDAAVGATVAASLIGVKWDSGAVLGEPLPAKPPRKRIKMSELYAKKHGTGGGLR